MRIEARNLRLESMSRGTMRGFKRYFSINPLLFQDIFEEPFSEPAAKKAFQETIEIKKKLPTILERLKEREAYNEKV